MIKTAISITFLLVAFIVTATYHIVGLALAYVIVRAILHAIFS